MFMFKSSRKVIFVLAVVMMIMVNCFCEMVDRRECVNLKNTFTEKGNNAFVCDYA